MELSAEMFADLASSTQVAPPRGHEGRRAGRSTYRFEAKIIIRQDGAPTRMVPTTICDFSPRGVGLEHEVELRPGQQFVLVLPGKVGAVSLLCTVVRNVVGATGVSHVGAEFVCVLDSNHAAQAKQPVDQNAELERIRRSILT